MTADILTRLQQAIADAEAEKAMDEASADATGERVDLYEYEVCLSLSDAIALFTALQETDNDHR